MPPAKKATTATPDVTEVDELDDILVDDVDAPELSEAPEIEEAPIVLTSATTKVVILESGTSHIGGENYTYKKGDRKSLPAGVAAILITGGKAAKL